MVGDASFSSAARSAGWLHSAMLLGVIIACAPVSSCSPMKQRPTHIRTSSVLRPSVAACAATIIIRAVHPTFALAIFRAKVARSLTRVLHNACDTCSAILVLFRHPHSTFLPVSSTMHVHDTRSAILVLFRHPHSTSCSQPCTTHPPLTGSHNVARPHTRTPPSLRSAQTTLGSNRCCMGTGGAQWA
jgi:hypothetical protein